LTRVLFTVHSELEATAFGVAATVAVVLLTSLKVVLSTLLFSGNKEKQWDSLPLLGEMSPKVCLLHCDWIEFLLFVWTQACILLLPWAAYEIWGHVNDGGVVPASQFVTFRMLSLLSGSGVAAFLLNYNNFLIFKYMDSPVAVAVFTNMRKVLTILASIVLFEQGAIEPLNVVGMLVTFAGVAVYTLQEMRDKSKQRRGSNTSGESIV
jgi:multidrug transporter EmrE-like cation transporter